MNRDLAFVLKLVSIAAVAFWHTLSAQLESWLATFLMAAAVTAAVAVHDASRRSDR